MYQIAICDDDDGFLHHLSQKTEDILCEYGLKRGTDFDIDLFCDAASMRQAVLEDTVCYHLLLLDIEISEESGMELARSFREHQITCSIIFITAYRDYVFDCFDVKPLWYLLKPLDEEKYKEVLLSDYRRNYVVTRLVLKIEGRQVAIPFSDIYALESTQHRTRIWLKEGYRDWNGALSAVKPELPSFTFCQSHNSYIVNLAHVKEVQRKDILMDNDMLFPVSRRYYSQTFDKYFSYLKI